MSPKLTAHAQIEIKAPSYLVWKALIDPVQIKKYFFGTEAISTWEEGSSLIFKGEWKGKTYEDKGTILKKDPNKLLQYEYWSSMSGIEDKPENYVTITYELNEKDGVTTLNLTQD